MSFSQSAWKFESNTPSPTPSHIYVDITVSNKDSNISGPQILRYNETRNSPYLQCPQDYYFSIIRFSVDTPSVPLFVPTVQTSSSDPNQTIYSITLTYLGVSSEQTYVVWTPQNLYTKIPSATGTTQDNTSGYYNCYSYQYWILLVNEAFQSAYTSLSTNYTLLNPTLTLPSNYAPFLTWNINSKTAVLNADIGTTVGGYLSSTVGLNYMNDSTYNTINIYFNSCMYTLFYSFTSIINGFGQVVNGISGGNVLIPIYSYHGINVAALSTNPLDTTTTTQFVQLEQEYSTISIWNPVQSIVFTTTSIPILPTNSGTPYIFDDTAIIANGNNANIMSIITDIQVGDGMYRPFVEYTPTSEYRLTDLVGNSAISNIDIYAYWKDSMGNLYPLMLSSGCSASFKLLFRKRSFNG